MLRTVVADCLLADYLCLCSEVSDWLKNSSCTLQPIIPITAVLAVLVYPISLNLHLASACFPALGSGLKERSWEQVGKILCSRKEACFSLFVQFILYPGSLEVSSPLKY